MRAITPFILLLSSALSAQVTSTPHTTPFILGDVLTFHSAILEQERVLNVYLPDGYADSTLSYPVIYILDGSANEDFPHIAGLAQFMNMYDLLPKSIVVGIANNGRSRYHDFTGPTEGDSDRVWNPTSGGLTAFMSFLEIEVQPMVKQHYRTSGHRTLIGQSLGGLMAAEVLFAKPELFDDYMLIGPSLWWNNGKLAADAEAWVKAHPDLHKRIFIASASNEGMMQKQVGQVVKAFQKYGKPSFQIWYEYFPNETHATLLHRAVYKGFECFYPQPKR
ncbi:MAG: alpha/beta hydrolase-fold protein [Flavobacteriales bacterium]